MKCPECEKPGLKSTLREVGGFSTAMYCEPWYDEDGNYHNHDLNTHTSHYTCSNGHRLAVSKTPKCPSCDFGGDVEILICDPCQP